MMGSGSKYLPYYYFLIMYRADCERERDALAPCIHTVDYLYRNLTTTSALLTGKIATESSRRSRHYLTIWCRARERANRGREAACANFENGAPISQLRWRRQCENYIESDQFLNHELEIFIDDSNAKKILKFANLIFQRPWERKK